MRRAATTASEVLGDAVEAGERLVDLGHPTLPRRLRRRNREPLPNLFELHPEARFAPRREVGLKTIPVSEIRGTAVEGGAQRGLDFLPPPRLRSGNWQGRWQRIRAAQNRLAILPPIDVLQTDEGYWVTDGHNRIAAALQAGQDEIDAVVTHVHLPGDEEPQVAIGGLAAMLAEGDELRAAGAGRLSRGSSLESRRGGQGSMGVSAPLEAETEVATHDGPNEADQAGR